jgi:acetoin utilization deacetylase AcuC-like enzyme
LTIIGCTDNILTTKEITMKVFYNENYTASKYAFDTTRKSNSISTSMIEYPIQNAELADPKEFNLIAESTIKEIHSPTYVQNVKTGKGNASSQGFDWDPGIYDMAVAHSAGLVAAVDEILSGKKVAGSLSSGLHHASDTEGAGFCTFNGLAVAARYAQESGINNIAILDLDAHAGGGTYKIIGEHLKDTTHQTDVVVSLFDTYNLRKDDTRSQIDILGHSSGDNDYMKAVRKSLENVTKHKPGLVIYNAGMDPINAGISKSTLAWREELIAEWQDALNVPLVFALAGGYTWGSVTMPQLTNLHRLTIKAFAEMTV